MSGVATCAPRRSGSNSWSNLRAFVGCNFAAPDVTTAKKDDPILIASSDFFVTSRFTCVIYPERVLKPDGLEIGGPLLYGHESTRYQQRQQQPQLKPNEDHGVRGWRRSTVSAASDPRK